VRISIDSVNCIDDRKILLVACDSMGLKRMMDELSAVSSKFLEMDIAIGGRNGLESLRAKQYDGVITDYLMPSLNGIQMLEEAYNGKYELPRIIKILTFTKNDIPIDMDAGLFYYKNDKTKSPYIDMLNEL
jgi:DNA-binding NtrC family response regulator